MIDYGPELCTSAEALVSGTHSETRGQDWGVTENQSEEALSQSMVVVAQYSSQGS